MDEDIDPIKASYDVFIKPRISEERRIYVLQFPNRDARQNYNASCGAEPLKMRIKPTAGMVELDVPIDAFNNYDREKGVKWGCALKKNTMAKGGGSHGLPGGFGIGGASSSGKGRGRKNVDDDEMDQESILENYEAAVQKEQILSKQTLGGQAISKDKTTPQYMIGTFRKDQLHLTPVDSIVQMRPQFHHIDAAMEQERANRVRDSTGSGKSAALAVHMTVKSQIDGEDGNSNEKPMTARIMAAQAEPWKINRYVDEDTDEAWAEYSESMFVCPRFESTEEIISRLPKLQSSYNNAEYLDVISGQRDSARLAKLKQKQLKDGVKNNRASDLSKLTADISDMSRESESDD